MIIVKMNKKKSITSLLLVYAMLCLHTVAHAKRALNPSIVQQAKQSIVSIGRQVAVAAYDMPTNRENGIGAVIDTEAGYILTIAPNIGPVMIAEFTVGFFNGATAKANMCYYDPWINFAILKVVDPTLIPKETMAVKLSPKLKEAQTVFTIALEKDKPSTVHMGKIFDTNMDLYWRMPQQYIGASMDTKVFVPGSLIFNDKGEGVAVNCGGWDTVNIGLHLGYVCYALTALNQNKEPIRKHIGALLKTYALDDAVRYDKLPREKQKAYAKQFSAGKNRILTVDAVLQGSPAENKLFPGDLIWAMDGKMVGPDLVDLDLSMNKSLKDSLVLTIFRQGAFHDVTVPFYNLNPHRITKMVEFGGTTFFETDDLCSKQGGVPAKTLTFCVAKPNTIFSKGIFCKSYGDTKFFGLKLLAINGQPLQTLDDVIARIPQLVKQKYFTMDFINHLPIGDCIGHDRYKANVEYDDTLEPPKVWSWNPIKLEWESQEII